MREDEDRNNDDGSKQKEKEDDKVSRLCDSDYNKGKKLEKASFQRVTRKKGLGIVKKAFQALCNYINCNTIL